MVPTSSRFSGREVAGSLIDFKSVFRPEVVGSPLPTSSRIFIRKHFATVPDLKSDFHPEAFCHGSDFESDFYPEAFCHGSDFESVFRLVVVGSPLPTSSRIFIRKRFATVPTSSRFSGLEIAGSLIDFKSDFHPEAFCHGSDFSRFSALRLSVPLCRLQVGFLSGSILPRFRLEVGFLPGSVLPWFRH